MGKQEADDGDRICSGFEHFVEVIAADATDGDERHFPDCLANAAQSFEANDRVRIIFRDGRVDGADGYVINGKARGFDSLLDVVCGETYDGALSQNLARSRRRKIRLSQMHAVRLKRERNVNAIIDDETHPARSCDAQGILSLLIKLTRSEMLFPQLNECRSTRAQARHLLGVCET